MPDNQRPAHRLAAVLPYDDALANSLIEAHESHLQYASEAWGRETGILPTIAHAEHYRSLKIPRLAIYTLPGATDLQLIADWYLWLLSFDDHWCDHTRDTADVYQRSRTIATLTCALDDRPLPPGDNDPWVQAFLDLLSRTRTDATPDQWVRFTESFHGYFLGILWESLQHHGRLRVTTAEYATMRPLAAGIPLWIHLADIAGSHRCPAAELARNDVRQLLRQLADITTLANDIVSHHKEATTSEYCLNLIELSREASTSTAAETLEEAETAPEGAALHYLETHHRVTRQAGGGLRGLIGELAHFLPGMLRWHTQTERYPQPT